MPGVLSPSRPRPSWLRGLLCHFARKASNSRRGRRSRQLRNLLRHCHESD